MEDMQSRIRSFFSSSQERLAGVNTGGELLEGAAAVLPPELLPNILHFVRHDDRRVETWEKYRRLASRNPKEIEGVRIRIEVDKAGPMYTLKSCALVCHSWANPCRRFMFRNKTLYISSLGDAQAFRYYATQGSQRLIAIHSLIDALDIKITYPSSARSLLDLIYLPGTSLKIRDLEIRGSGLSSSSNLHMGLPRFVNLPPRFTSYRAITVRNVHYRSFAHVTRYLKHFRDARKLLLVGLKWDGKVDGPLSYLDKPPSPHRPEISVIVKQCTDDLAVGWQAAMMYPDFSLRTVIDYDQQWALKMMRYVYDFYSKIPANEDHVAGYVLDSCSLIASRNEASSCSFGVTELDVKYGYPSVRLYFACEPKPRVRRWLYSGRSSPDPVRIVGLAIVVDAAHHPSASNQFSTVDLAVLRQEIAEHCAIRIVVFAFSNYVVMQGLVQQHPTLLTPPSDEHIYLFACRRSPEHPFHEVSGGDGHVHRTWVSIDPRTLDTTGEQWKDGGRSLLGEVLESRRRVLA